MYQGQKFVTERWYEVPDAMANYLSTITSRPGDIDSPMAFDVFEDRDHAQSLVRREREAKQRAEATIESPEVVGVLTTADLMSDEEKERREQERVDVANAKRAEEEAKEERRAARDAKREIKTTKGGKSPRTATKVSDGADDKPAEVAAAKSNGKGKGRGKSKTRKTRKTKASTSRASEDARTDPDDFFQ